MTNVQKPSFLVRSAALFACSLVLGVNQADAQNDPASKSGISPKNVSAAIAAARQGNPQPIVGLTSIVSRQQAYKPAKENLVEYRRYLEDTEKNVFIQWFAVTAIAKGKDVADVDLLQRFIINGQRRVQNDALTGAEQATLQLALQVAIAAVGDYNGNSDKSVAFLGMLLKHDIPKEWGGGVAHSALAKKGRPGLRRLLDESLECKEPQLAFIGSAIGEIRDPALAQDLYVASLDTKYPASVRVSTTASLARMIKSVPEAEQLVLAIFMTGPKELQRMAAHSIGQFGSTKGLGVLRGLRDTPGKCDAELAKTLDDVFLKFDTERSIDGLVNTVLSPLAPDEEKIRLCRNLLELDKQTVNRLADKISLCLDANNTLGVPLNAARVNVWLAIYRATKQKKPIQLMFDGDESFKRETLPIRRGIEQRYDPKFFPNQREQMAEEEAKKFVTKWVDSAKEQTK